LQRASSPGHRFIRGQTTSLPAQRWR
jgi:hypothetical protein